MAEIACFRRASPTPHDQAKGAGAFGGQLQSAGNHHRQPDGFGNDGAEPAEPQGLLAGLKDIVFADRLDIDDAVGVEADLCQGRRKEIGPRQTPDNRTPGASGHTGNEQGSGCAIDSARPSSCEFMDRAVGQSSARKPRVDLGNAERQDGLGTGSRSFEVLNAISKLCDNRVHVWPRHVRSLSNSGFHTVQKAVCSLFVPNRNVSQCACIGWIFLSMGSPADAIEEKLLKFNEIVRVCLQ